MSRIFISYKRKDKEKVFRIVREVEEATGVKCWVDLDGIETSAQFTSVLCKAIDDSEVVLFMHSKQHLNIDFEEDWTIKELNYARALKKRVVLVKIDNSPLKNLFLMEYGTKNNIDINDKDQKDKLFRDLRSWLKIDNPAQVDLRRSLVNGHRFVDLGLSVMWADENLADEFRSSFPWGDTEDNRLRTRGFTDTWDDYAFINHQSYLNADDRLKITEYITKYNNKDRVTVLEKEDDPAAVIWKGPWRTPTLDEVNELITKCKFSVAKGCLRCKGPNGNSILLKSPDVFWTATRCNGIMVKLGEYCSEEEMAYSFTTPFLDERDLELRIAKDQRCESFSIRPVCSL